MNAFKDRLKLLRTEKGLLQKELSDKLDIPRNTISSWEAGYRTPEISAAQKLADFFNVSLDFLLGRSDYRIDLPKEEIKIDGFFKVPVLGVIRAGEPMFAEQNIVDYEMVATMHIPKGECFFLLVVGDSMNLSNIIENSLVLVKVQKEVKNGEIAVVLVNGDDATVKRFYKNGSTVTLMPNSTNQMHQPKMIDTRETSVVVVGKVVQAVIRF